MRSRLWWLMDGWIDRWMAGSMLKNIFLPWLCWLAAGSGCLRMSLGQGKGSSHYTHDFIILRLYTQTHTLFLALSRRAIDIMKTVAN